MRLSVRIFIGYFVLVALAMWLYIQSTIEELKPAYLQPSEEVMVDTANLLAEMVQPLMLSQADPFQHSQIVEAIERYQQRRLNAQIWSHLKTTPDMIIYVTDAKGMVIYHSQKDQINADYSNWLDVSRTLQGEYGARTSESTPGQIKTRVAYVAAPIVHNEQIIGVLTVGKPHASLQPLLDATRKTVIMQGIALIAAALLFGILLSWWLTNSIRKLTTYAHKLRDGQRVDPPKLAEKELSYLAQAMTEMRTELRAANYVEQYIHSITHEMKSPIAAIRGAAELLTETQMADDQREHFIDNIGNESERLQILIDRLLELAKLEKQEALAAPETLSLNNLLSQLQQRYATSLDGEKRRWQLDCPDQPIHVSGDQFLLEIAINNLLDNALQFCPPEGLISIALEHSDQHANITIANQGEPVPEYAVNRVFDRFYSLPRPHNGRKSTGLGLAIAREIVALHKGSISLNNQDTGGVRVDIQLPIQA